MTPATPTGATEPRSVIPSTGPRIASSGMKTARQREHQHLRAHACAAAIRDEHAPRRRETEGGVIEHDPGKTPTRNSAAWRQLTSAFK